MVSETSQDSDPFDGRHLEQPGNLELQGDEEFCHSMDLLRAKVQAALQPGGPEVDDRLLHLLVAKQLSEDSAHWVWRNVLTWQTWNQAFRKIATDQMGDGHSSNCK